MLEVSLRACAKFQCERARAHLRLRCKRTRRFKYARARHAETFLSQRSFEYARSETLLRSGASITLRRSFECSRSEAWRVLQASTALRASLRTLSKLRLIRMGRSFDTRSFSFFRRKSSMVLAFLSACRRVGDHDETGGSLRRSVSNHIQTML